jgi:predicted dehydrogenase
MRMSLPKFHHEQTYFAEMPRLAVYELGVHYLDVYRFLFGEPDTLYARLQRISPDVVGEDVQNVMLGYDERNLTCHILHSWASVPIPDHDTVPGAHPWAVAHPFIIEGTDGTLYLEPDRSLHLYTDNDHQSWEFAPETRHEGRAGALQHFINCLDSGAEFETSGADTLKTMALVYACYESSEKKQVIRPQELL